jgi:phosphatidate phosphatase APP1
VEAFLSQAGFPHGTLHLRPFSVRHTLIESIYADDGAHKRRSLERLLADFPRRQFILVGDDTERDPEIYGDIARANPGRIKKIFIRDVVGAGGALPRFKTAFAGLPEGLWKVFTEPHSLEGGIRP